MMKDTFFSMPRFVNLCRKDMVENWRANVLRMVLMYGVMAVIMIWGGASMYTSCAYGIRGSEDPAWDFLLVLFMWGLFGFGSLSASFTMEKMKSKTGRLSALMTPATPFEKFFSRWFVSTIVFLVVFLIAYKLADYTRVLIYSLKYPEIGQIAATPLGRLLKPDSLTEDVSGYYFFPSINILLLCISLYFFVQSLFVLGSSVWPKNAFLKTFAAGIVIVIIYVLVAIGLSNLLFDGGRSFYFSRDFSEELIANIVTSLAVIMTLVNWTIAYFRFKESEIINRM